MLIIHYHYHYHYHYNINTNHGLTTEWPELPPKCTKGSKIHQITLLKSRLNGPRALNTTSFSIWHPVDHQQTNKIEVPDQENRTRSSIQSSIRYQVISPEDVSPNFWVDSPEEKVDSPGPRVDSLGLRVDSPGLIKSRLIKYVLLA